MKATDKIEVRKCQIECKDNPEWGTFGVMEDCGDWYEILGDSGHRILFKTEANKFWRVV